MRTVGLIIKNQPKKDDKKELKNQPKRMIKMAKFKNKKTGKIIVENLNFYIDKLRNNSNFEEMKEDNKSNPKKEKNKMVAE